MKDKSLHGSVFRATWNTIDKSVWSFMWEAICISCMNTSDTTDVYDTVSDKLRNFSGMCRIAVEPELRKNMVNLNEH